ncbi:hypothetical protein IWZ00DRAFT_577309 [Phyllosticta capitalensis]|uniref:BTB domain-containing protein n=2 Tax=Phyllosticta capitalensis TaxID=121624 RepID=A0ABR1YE44_9PEZI
MPWKSQEVQPELLQLDRFPKSDFLIKRHTDFSIQCQDKRYHVHKLILSMKSGFFNKYCDPNSFFSQARLDMVNLDKHHPTLVKSMLEYCYTGDFDHSASPPDAEKGWTKTEKKLQLYIQLYEMAHQYEIEALKQDILGWVRGSQEAFAMKGSSWSQDHMTPLGAAKVARKAFGKSHRIDRRLRNLILNLISKNIDTLMQDPAFTQEVDLIKNFWRYLTQFRADAMAKELLCPICQKSAKGHLEMEPYQRATGRRQCNHCKLLSDVDQWFPRGNASFDIEADVSSDDESTVVLTPTTEYSDLSK